MTCSLTGLLGPEDFQAIIDKDREDKLEHMRTHPYLCDYNVKKNVKCPFRGVSEAGLKIHARSQHMWKPGQELMFKYVDVAGIPPVASAAAATAAAATAPAAAAAAAPDAAAHHRAPAVGGGGSGAISNPPASTAPVAAAPKQRLCAACRQPGHQANSKKCPKKQDLDSHEFDDVAADIKKQE